MGRITQAPLTLPFYFSFEFLFLNDLELDKNYLECHLPQAWVDKSGESKGTLILVEVLVDRNFGLISRVSVDSLTQKFLPESCCLYS